MATTQQHSSAASQAQGTTQAASDDATAQTDNPALSAAAELQRLELMQRMPALDFCVMLFRLSDDAQWEIIGQLEQMGDVPRATLAAAAAYVAEAPVVRQADLLDDPNLAQYLSIDEQPNVVTISFTLPGEMEPSHSVRTVYDDTRSETWIYDGPASDDYPALEETFQEAEDEIDIYEGDQPDVDPASFAPVTGDATTWRVLGAGARAALALPREEDAALDASVAELVTTYPDEVQQILTIIRVRMGSRAVEAYQHISDPDRLRAPTKLHAIAIMTKRIAALDAVIAQESTGPHGGGATKTPANFGVVAAAHVERMDLEHSRDILATGKGRYEGAVTSERKYKTWTMKQRGGRAIDCTTFPFKVLADTSDAVGQPELYKAFQNAMHQVWRKKEGAGPNETPTVWDDDVLNGLRVGLGWKGFLIDPSNSYAGEESWNDVKVDPALAITHGDSMSLARARELPFAVIGQGGHMGLLVYGHWYEVHFGHSHDDVELIDAAVLPARWQTAAAMAPAADVERVLRAPLPQDDTTGEE
ncbi:MAG: hypothetical protein IPL79_13075 [Myxococcales bacterium]|nr:hypothetical protein [Myxococcales bacterium]